MSFFDSSCISYARALIMTRKAMQAIAYGCWISVHLSFYMNVYNKSEASLKYFTMSQKPFINTRHIPDDVFSYQNEQFYDFVREYIGQKQAILLAFQEISNANIFLNCGSALNILELDSAALISYKESFCLKFNDNSYTVLPGIESSFSYLTKLLTKKRDEMARIAKQSRSVCASSTVSVTNANDNTNMTITFNSSSLIPVRASSESNGGSVDITKSINHQRNRITSAINGSGWPSKNFPTKIRKRL